MLSKPSLWQRIADPDIRQAMREIANALSTRYTAGFRAYRQQALQLTGTANQPIIMDAVEFDLESEYSPVTGIFIPKHSGVYLMSSGVALNTVQAAGARIELLVLRSTNVERAFYYSTAGDVGYPNMSGSDLFIVNAGDYYQVAINVPTATTLIATGTNYTWFSALLVREFGG